MSAEAGPSQPPAVQPQVGKKRKRTGKEREERKQAAILAAAQAKEDEENEPTGEAAATTVDVAAEAEQVEEPETKAAEGPAVDLEALEKRLPRALTHLRHVFKKAKTIEMTRLIRKIKHLRTKPDAKAEMEDLEAQRQLLAHINLVSTYSSHLLINLRKHRLVKRTSTTLPPSVVKQLEPPSSSTVDDVDLVKKVENRLCSSKAAAQEMKNTVAWLMSEEGAKLGVAPPSAKVDASKGKNGQATKGQGKVASTSKSAAQGGEDDEDGSEGDEDEARGSVSIQRRVAVDSDNEEDDGAGWESGSVSGNDDPVPSKSRRQPTTAIANSDSDSDSDNDEDSIPVTRPSKSKKSKTDPSPAQPTKSKGKALTSSTFLPSLSTGFTRGDSDDSDPDDDFGEGLEDVIGKQKAGPRKNRRGQQARRLIWERKYGKNAKHIQKAQVQESEGNIANAYGKRAAAAGTAKPTSATAPNPTGNGTTPTSAPAKAAPRPYTPSAPPRAPTASTPVHTGPGATGLHPSWEAARLRKQKEAVAPKATKIVFD